MKRLFFFYSFEEAEIWLREAIVSLGRGLHPGFKRVWGGWGVLDILRGGQITLILRKGDYRNDARFLTSLRPSDEKIDKS